MRNAFRVLGIAAALAAIGLVAASCGGRGGDTEKYTVRFMNGADVVKTATVNAGSQLRSSHMPASPGVKDGKEFDGWYTSGGAKVDVDYTVNSDVTANARWDGDSISPGTITWHTNVEGAPTARILLIFSEAVTGLEEGDLAIEPGGGSPAGALTVKGVAPDGSNPLLWRIDVEDVTPGWVTIKINHEGVDDKTHQVQLVGAGDSGELEGHLVTFHLNGGTSAAPEAAKREHGTAYGTLPADPVRAAKDESGQVTGFVNHVFRGWWDTSAASGGSQLTAGTVINSSREFWARWERIPYSVWSGGLVSNSNSGAWSPNRDPNAVAFGNNLFVAVGENGIIAYSNTGESWSFAQAPSTDRFDLHSIAYAGSGWWLAGGTNGRLLRFQAAGTQQHSAGYAPENFSVIAAGNGGSGGGTGFENSRTIRGIAVSDGAIILVGDGGRITRSFSSSGNTGDGTWTRATATGTTNQLNAVAFGTGVVVAVGNGGEIVRSTDGGVNWSRVSVPEYSNDGMQVEVIPCLARNYRTLRFCKPHIPEH
ncbi:MAG: InlB B-repeat-containing protein [Treponema sp.]|nr:InlB B-repeat-containing protein [Treponema sp.]